MGAASSIRPTSQGSSKRLNSQGSAVLCDSNHPLHNYLKNIGVLASNLSRGDLEVTEVLDDGQICWCIREDANIWNLSEDLRLFADCVDNWPIIGRMSPTASLDGVSDHERSNALAPSGAQSFAWAVPSSIEFKTGIEETLERLMALPDPNLNFLLRGGWAFLDSENCVCKVTVLVPCESGGLEFGDHQKWNADWTLPLQDRFKKVTIKLLHDTGARYYCWIGPNDRVLRVFDGLHLPKGGFVYLFHEEILFDPREGDASLDCIIPLKNVLASSSGTVQQFSFVSDIWRQYSQYSEAMETPYGILAKHIQEEHRLGKISKAQYQVLLRALNDLTTRRRGSRVDFAFPERSEEKTSSINSWLHSFGIRTRSDSTDSLVAPPLQKMTSSLSAGTSAIGELLEHLPTLSSLELDAFTTSNSDIARMMVLGVKSPRDLVHAFRIDQERLTRWIVDIAAQYRPVPYHRWAHAWDTFQMTYILLTEGGVADSFLADIDILSVLIAAIGHDVRHPGVTNVFLSRTSADLAITYNDSSVLENMHAAVLFETLLQGDGLNFLEQLEWSEYQLFRQRTISSILATDMAHHFKMVDTLKHAFGRSKDKGEAFSPVSELPEHGLDPQEIIKAVLHFADVSCCARPPQVFLDRTAVIEEEFFLQGDQERNLGLPISSMMDRHKEPLMKSQAGFVNFVVAPLLYSMHEMIPGLGDKLAVSLDKSKTAVVEAANQL